MKVYNYIKRFAAISTLVMFLITSSAYAQDSKGNNGNSKKPSKPEYKIAKKDDKFHHLDVSINNYSSDFERSIVVKFMLQDTVFSDIQVFKKSGLVKAKVKNKHSVGNIEKSFENVYNNLLHCDTTFSPSEKKAFSDKFNSLY